MRPSRPALVLPFAAFFFCHAAAAQVSIVREPVYAFDARALAGANRIMARTRFAREGSSSMPHELAVAAARRKASESISGYEAFFRTRLQQFVQNAPANGLTNDDAADARACFIQTAYKIYRGEAGKAGEHAFNGRGLWGEGAIAAMAHESRSLARLQFRLRLKFIMGSNRRFAGLADRAKQRVYDFYAIAAELLAEGFEEAVRSHNAREMSYLRRQARLQLKADLGIDPERVRFTATGIEIH